VDTKVFQEKMKMLQYAQLPINSFNDLSPAKKYDPPSHFERQGPADSHRASQRGV
jgi:hypothetical protein